MRHHPTDADGDQGGQTSEDKKKQPERPNSENAPSTGVALVVVGAVIGAAAVGLYNYFFPAEASNNGETNSESHHDGSPTCRSYRLPRSAASTSTLPSLSSSSWSMLSPAPSSAAAAVNSRQDGGGGNGDTSCAAPIREEGEKTNGGSSFEYARQEQEKDAVGEALCTVCLALPATMLFNRCGHLCCCESCVQLLAVRAHCQEGQEVCISCPLCRMGGTVQKVFTG